MWESEVFPSVFGVSLASRSLTSLVSGLLLAFGLLASVPSPATSAPTTLCTGYSSCAAAGYSDAGYAAASGTSYWRMFTGRNCTNYVAYRLIQAGMPNIRPFSGTGNAFNWGVQLASKTDSTPAVGAVAWFKPGVGGAGSVGHTAYVEQVISPTEIVISESNFGSDFSWRRITVSSGWPSGFIHLTDRAIANTAPVAITGTAQVGQTLGSTPGAWTPAAAYAYQWLADGQPLAGATAPTLALTSALGGKTVVLRVTASAAGYGTTVADSAPTTVSLGGLTVSGAPAVSATGGASSKKNAVVGTVLTASEPTWAPSPRRTKVQWLADGAAIAGATDWSYRLAGGDVLKNVTAVVTARRPGYTATQAVSSPVGPVVAGRVTIDKAFAVKGPARVGKKLRVAPGAVTPTDASTAYTWRRGGTVIDGANGSSYRVTAQDVGARISVAVAVAREGWLTRRTVLTREAVVASAPTFTVTTLGTSRKAVVRFRIEAPGVGRPAGAAIVSVGDVRRTVTVKKGVGRLALKGLAPGKHTVTIVWKGTAKVLTGSTTDTVRVRG